MRRIRPGSGICSRIPRVGRRRWNLPWLLRRCSALARRFKIFSRCEGVAAVEFAIILPALMFLILGGMDLGHAYYLEHLITNASREGARYATKYISHGVTVPTSGQVSTYVKTTLGYNSFNLNNFQVYYPPNTPSIDSNGYTDVTVTVTADKYWWILGSLPGFTNPTTLKAQTTMIWEGP